MEQSETLGNRLMDVKFDICFCSPQKRTRQTCEIIYKGAVVFDERLKEINCGEFEGTEETGEMWKDFYKAAENGDMGAEKINDFMERNFSFCDTVSESCKGKNILIVTHAANIRAIVYYFQGKPADYDFSSTPVKSGEMIVFEN